MRLHLALLSRPIELELTALRARRVSIACSIERTDMQWEGGSRDQTYSGSFNFGPFREPKGLSMLVVA